MDIIITNMPPLKEQLTYGRKISCEIDGVKIEDANVNKMRSGNLYIEYDEGFVVIFDENITSDKYKIRLVEEEKEKFMQSINFIRQWLNEDRITDPKKMVTNEELLTWFK